MLNSDDGGGYFRGKMRKFVKSLGEKTDPRTKCPSFSSSSYLRGPLLRVRWWCVRLIWQTDLGRLQRFFRQFFILVARQEIWENSFHFTITVTSGDFLLLECLIRQVVAFDIFEISIVNKVGRVVSCFERFETKNYINPSKSCVESVTKDCLFLHKHRSVHMRAVELAMEFALRAG